MEESLIELFQNPIEITTLPTFILSMALSALLGTLLSLIYIKFGQSLSNRRSLAGNFLMLAVTTTLIITIVKSSLALSLGLVGALSIVRFRAAIKEPEELTYLFLAIGIGLGMGASQPLITSVAFVIIVTIIIIRHFVRPTAQQSNMFVTVTSSGEEKATALNILNMLKDVGAQASLKRSDDRPDGFEASFLVDFPDISSFEKFSTNMKEKSPNASVTCMDNHGIAS